MEDEKKLKRYKWIFYITVLFAVAILENTVLSKINILGGKPQLLIFAVILTLYTVFKKHPIWYILFGAVCGIVFM